MPEASTCPALLLEIPCPAFQAVVDRVSSPDVANLRLISTAVSSRATLATRSITLRLSDHSAHNSTDSTDNAAVNTASTASHSNPPQGSVVPPDESAPNLSTKSDPLPSVQQQQLQSWYSATARFSHVTAVHIHVTNKVTPQHWTAALRVLALRGNIRTLHILAAISTHRSSSSSSSSSTAAVPSLLPVREMLPHLHTLVVTGVTVTNMEDDITLLLAPQQQQEMCTSSAAAVAETAGFRSLQCLNLSCAWSPSGSLKSASAFNAAMSHLPHTVPALTHLTLQLPPLQAHVVPYVAPHAAAAQQAPAAAAAAAVAAAARMIVTRASAAAQHAQQHGSMLAAAVTAAAALPKLQNLELARVPDIWAGPHPAAAAAAAARSAVPAAALATLDDVGQWLLLRLPNMNALQINIVGATCCMQWSRGTAAASAATTTSSNSSGSGSSSSAAEPVPAAGIKLTFHAGIQPGQPTPQNSSSSRSGTDTLLPELEAHLRKYTRLPLTVSLPQITSLQAAVHPGQISSIAATVAAMPALRHLKLTALATSSRPVDFASLVAAAAAAPRLETLTLLPGLGRVEVAATALLPLTAAAGGPGRTLRELRLVGAFSTNNSSSASSSSSSSSSGWASVSPWAVLRQMEVLEVLRVHQLGPEVLDLPLDCLPKGLRALGVKRVHVLAPAAAAAAGDDNLQSTHIPNSSNMHNSSSSSSELLPGGYTLPDLTSLTLQDCQLDDVSSLSRDSLQQLTIAATELPGGWPAAVQAWSHLRHLTLWCRPAVTASSSSSSSGLAAACSSKPKSGSSRSHTPAATAQREAGAVEDSSVMLMHQLSGFQKLEGLELQHLPCLNPGVLHVVLQHMPHLSNFMVSAAGVSRDLSAAAAAATGRDCSWTDGGSSSKYAGASLPLRTSFHGGQHLKSISIKLPAKLPAALAAAAAAAPTAAAATLAAALSSEACSTSVGASCRRCERGADLECSYSGSTGRTGVSAQVLQGVLSQALPWAGVAVSFSACQGFQRC